MSCYNGWRFLLNINLDTRTQMDETIKALIGSGKWLILFPLRFLIATANLLPTPLATYAIVHDEFMGIIRASYKVEATARVHLGHFLVAWVRGLVSDVNLAELDMTRAEDDDSDMKVKRAYRKKALSAAALNEIRSDCKIW